MPKKIKNYKTLTILQVLPGLEMGGIETGTIDFAEYLADQGHQSLIASNGGKLVAKITSTKVKHFRLPLHSKNPLRIIVNIWQLSHLLRNNKVDIVHVRSRAPAWSTNYACMLCGVPMVTTFHGTYSFKTKLKKYYNAIMVRGDQVIAISQFIYNHIMQHYGDFTCKDNITVINRGVALEHFKQQSVTPTVRQELVDRWNMTTQHPLLVFPGRLTSWKGQLIAIEALGILKAQGLRFHAVFLGSDQGRTHYTAQMNALIKKYDLHDRVTIDQALPKMADAYGVADLTIHTSIRPEAFGRVIIEAQAMKCLVVASRCGAPVDIIQDGVTGFLHDPNDPYSLAATISQALSLDVITKNQMIDNAYNRVVENFTNTKMFKETVAVYLKALQVKPIL